LKKARTVSEHPLKILVVEDDRIYAEFVTDTLRDAGHDVVHATNGRDARDHAPRFLPDAVMLDLVLPDESGYDIGLALRAVLPEPSVVILLTAELYPNQDLASAAGIDMVLTKPVEPALVMDLVDHLRRRRQRKLEQSR
jgi:DNA-binding response OmpR family regulator